MCCQQQLWKSLAAPFALTEAFTLVGRPVDEDFGGDNVAEREEHLHELAVTKLLGQVVDEQVAALGSWDRASYHINQSTSKHLNLKYNTQVRMLVLDEFWVLVNIKWFRAIREPSTRSPTVNCVYFLIAWSSFRLEPLVVSDEWRWICGRLSTDNTDLSLPSARVRDDDVQHDFCPRLMIARMTWAWADKVKRAANEWQKNDVKWPNVESEREWLEKKEKRHGDAPLVTAFGKDISRFT